MLGSFSCFCCRLLTFFKINFFKNFFKEHYVISVKLFGSRWLSADNHLCIISYFSCFCCRQLFFKLLKKFFHEHYQCVKGFGSRSGPWSCDHSHLHKFSLTHHKKSVFIIIISLDYTYLVIIVILFLTIFKKNPFKYIRNKFDLDVK